jgi:sulfate-transporting ATPase
VTEFVRFFVLGLSSGGIYALLALAIVLVYRSSGIVNFSAGGMVFLGAALYYELSVVNGWPTPLAIVVSVLACAAAGVLIQLVVMRVMRDAAPLARVIATLGVLSLVQQAGAKRYGITAHGVPGFLPAGTLSLFGARIGVDRVVILGLSVVLSIGLSLAYRRTRFGLATTGVAENERVTAALGWSPTRIAATNWALGSALSGLAGILLVPIVSLAPSALTLTIVPALSVALIAGFASFPLTLCGGLLLGVLESEAVYFQSRGWLPIGWSTAMPFVVIVVVLVLRGRALPIRGHLNDRMPRVGAARVPWPGLIIGAAVVLISMLVYSPNWINAITTSAIFALLCMSLVVVTGYAGQLSLAQFALAGVGALVASRLANAHEIPFLPALLLGVAATVPLGALVALPAVRVRGVNLAVVTLSLATVISSMILANPTFTGGTFGSTTVPAPAIFGWSVESVAHPERYALVSLTLLVLMGAMVANLRRGTSGRRLVAVRANERGAASLGVRVAGAKVYAFAVGAAIAAAAGVMIAFRHQVVAYDQFGVFQSVSVLTLGVIGGVGYVSGSLLSGMNAPAGMGEQQLSAVVDLHGWFELFAAGGVILIVLTHQDGLAHVVGPQLQSVFRRFGQLLPIRTLVPADVQVEPAQIQAQRASPRRLEVRDLCVRFGAVQAVDHVAFVLSPGEVVGLMGPNGAGKTTVIDAISGFQRQYAGSVLLGDQPIERLNAPSRARSGVVRSFQNLELFDDLTVEDNLRIGSETHRTRQYLSDLVRPRRPALSSAACAAIAEFRLEDVLHRYPTELPYAQRRLVAIARSVAAAPSVLLLDEPAAGLDQQSSTELAALIRRLATDWGMAVLLIEHDVSMLLATCDRVLVLNFGRLIADDVPAAVRAHPEVVSAYLGSGAPTSNPPLDHLTSTGVIDGHSFN